MKLQLRILVPHRKY